MPKVRVHAGQILLNGITKEEGENFFSTLPSELQYKQNYNEAAKAFSISADNPKVFESIVKFAQERASNLGYEFKQSQVTIQHPPLIFTTLKSPTEQGEEEDVVPAPNVKHKFNYTYVQNKDVEQWQPEELEKEFMDIVKTEITVINNRFLDTIKDNIVIEEITWTGNEINLVISNSNTDLNAEIFKNLYKALFVHVQASVKANSLPIEISEGSWEKIVPITSTPSAKPN